MKNLIWNASFGSGGVCDCGWGTKTYGEHCSYKGSSEEDIDFYMPTFEFQRLMLGRRIPLISQVHPQDQCPMKFVASPKKSTILDINLETNANLPQGITVEKIGIENRSNILDEKRTENTTKRDDEYSKSLGSENLIVNTSNDDRKLNASERKLLVGIWRENLNLFDDFRDKILDEYWSDMQRMPKYKTCSETMMRRGRDGGDLNLPRPASFPPIRERSSGTREAWKLTNFKQSAMSAAMQEVGYDLEGELHPHQFEFGAKGIRRRRVAPASHYVTNPDRLGWIKSKKLVWGNKFRGWKSRQWPFS